MEGGGGVAFYIKEDLKYKVKESLSIFEENIFENLVIEKEHNFFVYLQT